MIYTRPLRRTNWLSRWRVRSDFNELRIFIVKLSQNLGHSGRTLAYALFSRGNQHERKRICEAASIEKKGPNFELPAVFLAAIHAALPPVALLRPDL